MRRLHTSGDIRAVFGAHCLAASPYASLHMRVRADRDAPRAAVVAGKTVGNAVRRNRVKRRLRALLSDLRLELGRDYVIVGRTAAAAADSALLRQTLQGLVVAVEERHA